MKLLLVAGLTLGLAACASQQSACMTDEEIAAYRAETGTKLNDAALRAGCQQSESGAGAGLKAGFNILSNVPWIHLL